MEVNNGKIIELPEHGVFRRSKWSGSLMFAHDAYVQHVVSFELCIYIFKNAWKIKIKDGR